MNATSLDHLCSARCSISPRLSRDPWRAAVARHDAGFCWSASRSYHLHRRVRLPSMGPIHVVPGRQHHDVLSLRRHTPPCRWAGRRRSALQAFLRPRRHRSRSGRSQIPRPPTPRLDGAGLQWRSSRDLPPRHRSTIAPITGLSQDPDGRVEARALARVASSTAAEWVALAASVHNQRRTLERYATNSFPCIRASHGSSKNTTLR